jgi:hypothetical protein
MMHELRIRCVGRHGLIRSRNRTRLRVAGLPEPVPCRIFTHKFEMLHLRVDEMVCDARHDIRQGAVRDDRNFLDSLKMRLEELQVSKQRAEIFPARKRFCADQHAAQRPMLFQISIYLARQRREISRFKRPFWIEHEYSVVVSYFMVEHWTSSIRLWREYASRGKIVIGQIPDALNC